MITVIPLLMFCSAALFLSPYIAKAFKLPISVCEILLGVLGASLGILKGNADFNLVATVGFYYLMFIAGLEVDIRAFLKIKKRLAQQCLLYLIIIYLLSSMIVLYIDLSLVFIIMFPIMSVGLLSMLFKDFGKNEEWLNTAMLVGTLGEIISIVLLTLLSSFNQENATALSIFISIVYFIGFIIIFVMIYKLADIFFWWFPKIKKILMPNQDKAEKDLRLCLALFIFIIAIMLYFHLEIAFGVFLSGAYIRAFFAHKKDLEHKLSSLGYGFLIPIFFMYIGSTFDIISLLNYEALRLCALISISMFVVRLISSLVFLKDFGLKKTTLFSLSKSMPLTLLIATSSLSLKANIIDSTTYSALVLSALIEAMIAMSLISFISKR